MPTVFDIEKYCNSILEPEKFEDDCFNGIQIENQSDIKKIISGVTLDDSLIEKAINKKANLILVHHGFFGKDLFHVRGRHYRLVKKLLENNLGVIGYHLPLDAHFEIGNNASLMRTTGLNNFKRFGRVGLWGEFEKNIDIKTITDKLLKAGLNPQIMNFKNEVKTVVICSGGGFGMILKINNGLIKPPDLYITGEILEMIEPMVQEINFCLITLGHDASETSGIQNLGNMIAEKFRIEHKFVH